MAARQRIYYLLLIIFCISLFIIIGKLFLKIIDLKKDYAKGVQYVIKLNKEDLIFDSDNKELKYFYEPKPNSETVWKPDWLGYEVRNKINADSFNEEKEYPIQKEDKTYRIITLGDSHTFGQYVKTPDNYSKQLENQLNSSLECDNINKFEVINIGVCGYDIAYSVERFINRGIKYDPDLVIWLLTQGNFEKIDEYLIPYQKENGSNNFDQKTNSYPVEEQWREKMRMKNGENFIANYQKNYLMRMSSLYKKNLMLFSFAHLPDIYKNILKDVIKSNQNYNFYDKLTNIYKDKKYVFLDGHPNNRGHEIIAKEIFTYLQSNFLSNCILIK